MNVALPKCEGVMALITFVLVGHTLRKQSICLLALIKPKAPRGCSGLANARLLGKMAACL